MRPNIQPAVFLLLASALTLHARAGEVVDRIVASVNQQIVLESELQVSVAYQCLANHSACLPLGPEGRSAALERLIEQKLLQQQMQGTQFTTSSDQDVAQRIKELKRELIAVGTQTDESQDPWQSMLRKYDLTQADVEREVALETDLLRFVDARFRPRIRIEDGQVENYYSEILLPQLKASGGNIPKLDEVAGRIREVLVQQRINEELADWLKNLREQSTIRIR